MARTNIVEKKDIFTRPICNECKNYTSNGKCKAFPAGIPVEVLNRNSLHKKPLKDQKNEIVFEEI